VIFFILFAMLDTEAQGADKSLVTGATPSSDLPRAELARLADNPGAAAFSWMGIYGLRGRKSSLPAFENYAPAYG
jgi:hypothetical protein